MKRRDKINYYLDIAETVLERSTCIRRNFGAIIVKNDEIISTGYNGAPRGRINCSDSGNCFRDSMNIPKGQRYELCRAVHAEQNAIISASRADLMGSDIYLACHDAKTGKIDGAIEPCLMCKRFIINAGIERVIVRNTKDSYTIFNVADWLDNDESVLSNGYWLYYYIIFLIKRQNIFICFSIFSIDKINPIWYNFINGKLLVYLMSGCGADGSALPWGGRGR